MRRYAYAQIKNNTFTLGDVNPRANHLAVTTAGIVLRPTRGPAESIHWSLIEAITVQAPLARFRPPAWLAATTAAATLALGLDWLPAISDVPMTIVVASPTGSQTREFNCSGFMTRGYKQSRCDNIQTALNLLVRDESFRQKLNEPHKLMHALKRLDSK